MQSITCVPRDSSTTMRTTRRSQRGLQCLAALASLALSVAACGQTNTTAARSDQPACQVEGERATLNGLPEASGIAASPTRPEQFWTLNDSGLPELFRLDGRGAVTGRVELEGATVTDWEAVAAGPCPSGSMSLCGGHRRQQRHARAHHRLSFAGTWRSTAAGRADRGVLRDVSGWRARCRDAAGNARRRFVHRHQRQYGAGGDLPLSSRSPGGRPACPPRTDRPRTI